MKTIDLSISGKRNAGKYVAIIDDCDFEWASRFRWFARQRQLTSGIYVTAQRNSIVHGRQVGIYLHREVWERAYGMLPKDLQVDHVEPGEFGALDNRRQNLRLATRQQQQGNRRRCERLQTAFKGVKFNKNRKWEGRIRENGNLRYLGSFLTAEEAAKAYDAAAIAYFGEFARLNFPHEKVQEAWQ